MWWEEGWDLECHEERLAFDVGEREVYASGVSGMWIAILNDMRDVR